MASRERESQLIRVFSHQGRSSENAGEIRRVSLPANVALRRDPIRVAAAPEQDAPHETSAQHARRTNDNGNCNDGATKPVSLFPSCLLGLAMAARGEIGYLIASVAESSGTFASGGETSRNASSTFLIVIWAVSLCILVSPISVGLLVRRVRRLEKEKGKEVGRRQALGIWGVGNDE